MMRASLAALAVFIVWSVLGFVLHGVILNPVYAQTAQLFRPMAEFKYVLNYAVGLISAVCFVVIYAQWIADRSLRTALMYGLVWGIGAGISMGYGSYSAMPLPYPLALGWFLGTLLDGIVGGWVAWLIVGRPAAQGR